MPEAPDEPNRDQPTPKESRWLIGIVASALVLRILMLLLRATDLQTDPDAYVAIAETIKQTTGFNSPDTTTPTAFRPPLYPLAVSVLLFVGLKTKAAISIIALFAGVVVTIATWWSARMLGLRGVWPGVAAALAAADPLLLRYTPIPMTETLTAALLSVAVLQMLKILPSTLNVDQVNAPHPMKSAMVAGIAFSLAGFCRPICFLTCGVMTCGLLLRYCFDKNVTDRSFRQLSVTLLPTLVAGVMLTPWIVRNAVQLNAFVPLTTHGGYTLLLGNNEVFYRDVVMTPGQPVWSAASLTVWQHELNTQIDAAGLTTEPEKDRWMYARARQDISAAPDAFLRACLLRWKRFWGVQPRVDGQFAYGWIIGSVGIWYSIQWIGLVAAFWRIRTNPNLALLWLAVVSFLLLHTFYWTNTRMRAPLTGVIVVLVVCGWEHLYRCFARRRAAAK